MLEELKKQLQELGEELSMYRSLGEDLTDEQAEKYKEVKNRALKLRIRIEGIEEEEQAKALKAAQVEEEVQKRIEDAVDEAVRKEAAKYRRPAFEDGGAPRIAEYADTYKYDTMDAVELSLMMELQHRLEMPIQPGAYKALSFRIAEMDPLDSRGVPEGMEEEHRKNISYVKNAFKAGTPGNIEPKKEAIEAAIKADSAPMYTGASPMSDWVGTAYSQAIWEKIRGGLVVASRVPSDTIPDGYSSKVWPLESTDLTWYKVNEASTTDATLRVPDATITASAIGTANKTLTVGKLGARGLYTGEATEDSLIAFAPQLRTQLQKSGMEQLEHLMVDGDTETSATKNINSGGATGTITGDEVFLVANGFRKLALVTNTANSRSAGGAFVLTDFKDTLKLMGPAGLNASDPTAVAFIIDYNTMWAAVDLPEVKTKETFTQGTIEDGFLTRIYRTEVLNSFQMHGYSVAAGYERLVNSAGYVDKDTDSNNAYGAILAVRFDQWKQAFKRRMTMEVTRLARSDSWEIVALMRWGMNSRDNEASAITYYLGV